MSMISDLIDQLKCAADQKSIKQNAELVKLLNTAANTIRVLGAKVRANNMHGGWIPVEEDAPPNDDYILVSFENFPIPDIGRYEVDDKGGAFYPEDEDESYVSFGLFVNAWMPLPEPYKEDGEEWRKQKNTDSLLTGCWM